jgi:rod shape-determining protein MreD
MAYLIGIPLLAFLAVLQSAIFGHIRLLDGRPDLVLLAIVGWGVVGRGREAMVWGLIGGLFLDLLSGIPFGASAIALVLVAYLASFSEGRLWEAHLLMPLGVTLMGSLLYHGLTLAALMLAGHTIDLETAAMRVLLPSTFLNLVLALPAAQLAEALRRSFSRPEVTI